MASYKYNSSGKCPLLTASDIPADTLCNFENGCLIYFNEKDIASKSQVRRILGAFQDPSIMNWINSNHAYLITLSFADFMMELCSNYMDPDWEKNI